MSEKFLKLLQKRSEPTKATHFNQLLMGEGYQSWGFIQSKATPTEGLKREEREPEVTTQELTEKNIVLDSLQRFTQKVKERGVDKISIPGGEIVLKEQDQSRMQTLALAKEWNWNSYHEQHLRLYGEAVSLARLSRFKQEQNIKVYFLVDKLSLEPMYNAPHSGFEDLRYFFSEETAVLFSKMIQAMKLGSNDYAIGAVNFLNDDQYEYRYELAMLAPKLVITLGATATNELLNLTERLNNIHGKFFTRKILSHRDGHEFLVMPLFNPEFLRINPSMKKTAWEDMQKAMKKLGD